MILTGNIVQNDRVGYGTVSVRDSAIGEISISEPARDNADWILPGFIDVHLHGLGYGGATAEKVSLMAAGAAQTGLTAFCPTMASDSPDKMLDFVKTVRDIVRKQSAGETKIAGSHLEGPFIEFEHRGGMNPALIRNPDRTEAERLLDMAGGTLKIMTLSPELPGAMELTRFLSGHGVRVSAGHTGMTPEQLPEFVSAGGRAVCHLFDTFDGRTVAGGVSQVSLADAAIVGEQLFLELIGDGIHVPPALYKLAVRAAGAERILGITDSLTGTGLPDGAYPMTDAGRNFILKNGDVCRLEDDPSIIVGSCLTQNRAFHNCTRKFGISPQDAAKILSTTPARYLGLDGKGEIRTGFSADIAVLAPDCLTVRKTLIDGRIAYERN